MLPNIPLVQTRVVHRRRVDTGARAHRGERRRVVGVVNRHRRRRRRMRDRMVVPTPNVERRLLHVWRAVIVVRKLCRRVPVRARPSVRVHRRRRRATVTTQDERDRSGEDHRSTDTARNTTYNSVRVALFAAGSYSRRFCR